MDPPQKIFIVYRKQAKRQSRARISVVNVAVDARLKPPHSDTTDKSFFGGVNVVLYNYFVTAVI